MYDTLIVENLLSQEEIAALYETAKSLDFIPSNNTSNLKVCPWTINEFRERANAKIESLYNCTVLDSKGYTLLKYTEGDAINSHQDFEESYEDETQFKPIVSAIMYLNDDYTGGELCLGSRDQTEVFIKLKPRPGTTIIFDARQYHWTYPVISGTRYSYTAFYKI
jgi:predicted 2-oxoglutarate/Fe(II)-dependent dioxygenase YbiX